MISYPTVEEVNKHMLRDGIRSRVSAERIAARERCASILDDLERGNAGPLSPAEYAIISVLQTLLHYENDR